MLKKIMIYEALKQSQERRNKKLEQVKSDVCRLCKASNVSMVGIFDCVNRNLAKDIQFCTGILVQKTGDLPKKICKNCLAQLKTAYIFKVKCLKTQKELSCKSSTVKNEYNRIRVRKNLTKETFFPNQAKKTILLPTEERNKISLPTEESKENTAIFLPPQEKQEKKNTTFLLPKEKQEKFTIFLSPKENRDKVMNSTLQKQEKAIFLLPQEKQEKAVTLLSPKEKQEKAVFILPPQEKQKKAIPLLSLKQKQLKAVTLLSPKDKQEIALTFLSPIKIQKKAITFISPQEKQDKAVTFLPPQEKDITFLSLQEKQEKAVTFLSQQEKQEKSKTFVEQEKAITISSPQEKAVTFLSKQEKAVTFLSQQEKQEKAKTFVEQEKAITISSPQEKAVTFLSMQEKQEKAVTFLPPKKQQEKPVICLSVEEMQTNEEFRIKVEMEREEDRTEIGAEEEVVNEYEDFVDDFLSPPAIMQEIECEVTESNETPKCYVCDIEFPTYEDRRWHFKDKDHKARVKEKCGTLVVGFQRIWRHDRMHKPPHYICDQCDYKTWFLNDFKRHLYLHSEEKQYQCGYCAKMFALSSNLYNHVRRMHENDGVRRFECNICNSKYTSKHMLKRHALSHLNLRNFECDICYSRFNIYKHLKRHMKNLHSIMLPNKKSGRRRNWEFLETKCDDPASSASFTAFLRNKEQ